MLTHRHLPIMSFAPPEAHQQFQVSREDGDGEREVYRWGTAEWMGGLAWRKHEGDRRDGERWRGEGQGRSVVTAELALTPQHILRLLNTNVKGQGKIMFALTEIKGVGRRYANLVCKKADVDMSKR
jgi:hypothetical protein